MSEEYAIARVTDLSRDRLAVLLAESEASGYRFVRRLVNEWERGVNRFTRPGEALFAAESGGQVVGVCGLNIDPYLEDPRVGAHAQRLCPRRVPWAGFRATARRAGHRGGPWTFRPTPVAGRGGGPGADSTSRSAFRPCPGMPDCTHILELEG